PAGVGESSSADGSSSRRMARGAAPWPKSIRPIEDVRRPPHIARAVLCEPEGAAATRKGDAPALAGETDTVQERSGGGALRTMVRPTAGALARSQRDCPGETEGSLREDTNFTPTPQVLGLGTFLEPLAPLISVRWPPGRPRTSAGALLAQDRAGVRLAPPRLRGSRCHAPRGGILIPGARRASPGSG
ncbi:unnamed protein product, partial [Prorocentrum cordatum]